MRYRQTSGTRKGRGRPGRLGGRGAVLQEQVPYTRQFSTVTARA